MSNGVCTQKSPYAVELEPGDYYYCACGKSTSQPFCDGSHQGSDFVPTKITVTEKETKYLCGCRSSGNSPFCDGTHKSL
jgi:CDGSH iron-sulfur domain-containing protein 3